MIEHKDVVLAIMATSAGLAGLDLVFLGLVATATGAFSPGTKPTIIAKARRPALAVLFSFMAGIGCVAVATAWLVLLRDVHSLYLITLVLFVTQLASLCIATVWAVRRTLWG